MFIDTLKLCCRLGYNYENISRLQTTHEHGRPSCFFSIFWNSLVERLSLISLGRLFQRRLARNKSEFIPWRVECIGGRCNVFSFLKSYGFFPSWNNTTQKFDLKASVARKRMCHWWTETSLFIESSSSQVVPYVLCATCSGRRWTFVLLILTISLKTSKLMVYNTPSYL